MNLQRSKLSEILKCKICNNYLTEPCLLPCGKNVCKNHLIIETTEDNSKFYKCKLCNHDHRVFEEGFCLNTLNTALTDILEFDFHLDLDEETQRKHVLIKKKLLYDSFMCSNILDEKQTIELIKLCEFDLSSNIKLIYRATEDGFGASDFHSKCDKIKRTLSIIKPKDNSHVFGAYTEATWEGTGSKFDNNSFIFSLVNDFYPGIKIKVNENDQFSIYANPKSHLIYGGGPDLFISSDSNTNNNSYSVLGTSYIMPWYVYELRNTESKLLAGSKHFTVSEIEVYKIE